MYINLLIYFTNVIIIIGILLFYFLVLYRLDKLISKVYIGKENLMENNIGKKNNVKRIKAIIASFIIVSIIFVLVLSINELRYFDFKNFRYFILSYGDFAALCFVLIFSLKPILVFVPTSILSIIAGSIFGPFTGLCLCMISSFFSSTLAFFLARFLGKPFVDKTIGGKALKLDENIGENGLIIILLMRLSIIFPFDALSYACGLSKMKYRDYILGTMIGILPEITVYSFMGNSIRHPFSVKFLLPILLVVSLAVISYFVYKKSKETA